MIEIIIKEELHNAGLLRALEVSLFRSEEFVNIFLSRELLLFEHALALGGYVELVQYSFVFGRMIEGTFESLKTFLFLTRQSLID